MSLVEFDIRHSHDHDNYVAVPVWREPDDELTVPCGYHVKGRFGVTCTHVRCESKEAAEHWSAHVWERVGR